MFSREKKGFEIAKVNSRCFCWFPAAMLVPIRRGTNMASHTKLCNFPWYIFSNNSIRRYRTALWLSHVVYVSLFYNISISWLYLLNGWGFYFFTCVTMCEVKTTYCMSLIRNCRSPLMGSWQLLSYYAIDFLSVLMINHCARLKVYLLYLIVQSPWGEGGGGTWVKFCLVCAAGLSEPLLHYGLFCGQL